MLRRFFNWLARSSDSRFTGVYDIYVGFERKVMILDKIILQIYMVTSFEIDTACFRKNVDT